MERERRAAPASRPAWRATRWASSSASSCSGPAFAAAHAGAPGRDLGFDDDAALAAALRAGALDDDWEPVAPALAASARDQLLVANPSYLPAASGVERRGTAAGAGVGRRRVVRLGLQEASATSVTRAPTPCEHGAGHQAAADHEDPGVVEGVHGALPGGGAEDGDQAGHAERDADLAASWRRAPSRWRSAGGAAGAVAAPPSEGSISPTPMPLSRLPGR